MPILIDGHNLIHALPDIDLDDPNDEAMLVERLKSYSARTRKRCVVVFDRGLPGGLSRDLSTSQVTVIFASDGHNTADEVLRKRIRAVRDPGNYLLVSSDLEVRAAAEQRRMPVMTSAIFAAHMREVRVQAQEDARSGDVHLAPDEVEMWLKLFQAGQEDE